MFNRSVVVAVSIMRIPHHVKLSYWIEFDICYADYSSLSLEVMLIVASLTKFLMYHLLRQKMNVMKHMMITRK